MPQAESVLDSISRRGIVWCFWPWLIWDRCFDTDDYSDLTIKCRDRFWKVHRLIVCSQSKVYIQLTHCYFSSLVSPRISLLLNLGSHLLFVLTNSLTLTTSFIPCFSNESSRSFPFTIVFRWTKYTSFSFLGNLPRSQSSFSGWDQTGWSISAARK